MKAALAVLSGALLGLAFPRTGLGLVSFVALVPLLWVLHPPGSPRDVARRPGAAFRLGYLTGVAFFLVLLHWIPRLPRENVTIPFAMYPALLIMVAYLALYPGLAAMGSAWLARRGVPLGLSFPFLWMVLEAFRGTGTFGFAWGSLGYVMARYPHLIQFAEFTGVWGVTLWIVFLNGAIHFYLSSRWVRPKLLALGGILLLIVPPYFHGRHVLENRDLRPGMDVGMIQPNVGDNKWQLAVRDSVIRSLLHQTEEFATENPGRSPEIILWPETAVPARLPRDAFWLGQVRALVDSIGIPVLAGFPDGYRLPDGKARYTNSAALILPGEGLVQQYDKRHLVPFSEYFPLPLLNRIDFGQSSFSAGDRPGVMSGIRWPFGVLICFESIFPGPSRTLRRDGARVLVNITNDQWFGDSAAPYQHFDMNILRCIENRISMVRAANTGISGQIDSYGLVVERTPTFVTTSLVTRVEAARKELSLYTRFGDWILVLGWLSIAAMGVWAWRGGGR